MATVKGTIISLSNGFGEIQVQNQADSVFFHVSEVDGPFQNYKLGETVEFDLEEGPKGFMARKVHHTE